jgi:hypothetical protein
MSFRHCTRMERPRPVPPSLANMPQNPLNTSRHHMHNCFFECVIFELPISSQIRIGSHTDGVRHAQATIGLLTNHSRTGFKYLLTDYESWMTPDQIPFGMQPRDRSWVDEKVRPINLSQNPMIAVFLALIEAPC